MANFKKIFALVALTLLLVFTTACSNHIPTDVKESTSGDQEASCTKTGSSNNIVTKRTVDYTLDDYKKALTKEEEDKTLEIAKNYYKDKKFLRFLSLEEMNNVSYYFNEGLESNYSPGNIIIYSVKVMQDGEEMVRRICLARGDDGNWQVINEGY